MPATRPRRCAELALCLGVEEGRSERRRTTAGAFCRALPEGEFGGGAYSEIRGLAWFGHKGLSKGEKTADNKRRIKRLQDNKIAGVNSP